MSGSSLSWGRLTASSRHIWPERVPIWAIIAFSAAYAFSMSPNLVYVFGIHNDYEMLVFKNHGILFHEAARLFEMARPVAALLCNITLLPAESLADFRFTRIFSVATVCFLAFQMMSICVHRLRVELLPSFVMALITLLVPAFIYSVLNAPAWAIQLLPILIAFVAYDVLSNSNIQAIPFLLIVRSGDLRAMARQLLAYCRLPTVWGASLVLQVAFYDFPPNALVLVVLPVVAVLFSRAPASYRMLIAVRDIGFVIANLAIYFVSAKVVYLPFVGLLIGRPADALQDTSLSKFDARLAASYDYKVNVDFSVMLERLRGIAKASGDLWFMPQTQAHLVVGTVITAALAILAGRWLLAGRIHGPKAFFALSAVAVTLVCFLLANAAVLGAAGGFIEYRTIVVSTMIAAVVFVFAAGSLARMLGMAIGRSAVAGTVVANVALLLVAGAAVAGNFDMNYLTMKLARNETAYFTGIVRQAIENHSKAIIIVDPRPFTLPEDHPEAYDEAGRAIPPYILSCFSGYCMQNGAIITVLAEQFGVPRGSLPVYSIRGGELIPNATCEMLTTTATDMPARVSDSTADAIRFLRSLQPVTCVRYSLAWHNIGGPP